MHRFSPSSNGHRVFLLGVLVIAITWSGLPLVHVHSHGGGAVAHHHDLHDYFAGEANSASAAGDEAASTAEDPDAPHAHAIGAQGAAVPAPLAIDAALSPPGRAYVQPVADRLPDKIAAAHFRPPIA